MAWTAIRWWTARFDHGYAIVDLKAMGSLGLDAWATNPPIPTQFATLDGHRVAVVGFVNDANNASDQTRLFWFVCAASHDHPRPPLVQERDYCTVPNNGTVYNPGKSMPVRMFGTLHVGVRHGPDGQLNSIYRMDVDCVDPIQ